MEFWVETTTPGRASTRENDKASRGRVFLMGDEGVTGCSGLAASKQSQDLEACQGAREKEVSSTAMSSGMKEAWRFYSRDLYIHIH